MGKFLFSLFNPIPTGLCHVITVYGLIQPSAGRNRVNCAYYIPCKGDIRTVFAKVHSLLEHSCAILISFKIVVIFNITQVS